jgi:hypothetical protein
MMSARRKSEDKKERTRVVKRNEIPKLQSSLGYDSADARKSKKVQEKSEKSIEKA